MRRNTLRIMLSVAIAIFAIACGQDQSNPTATNRATMPQLTDTLAQSSQGAGGEHHAEQIVFSGQGTSTLGPFGFWIWSMDEDAAPPYRGEAAGSIYIYALGLTRGVEGEVVETSEGVYEITVEARRDGAIEAILTNVPPTVHGPHNTVNVQFITPSGSGSSTDAVVNVTGPEE